MVANITYVYRRPQSPDDIHIFISIVILARSLSAMTLRICWENPFMTSLCDMIVSRPSTIVSWGWSWYGVFALVPVAMGNTGGRISKIMGGTSVPSTGRVLPKPRFSVFPVRAHTVGCITPLWDVCSALIHANYLTPKWSLSLKPLIYYQLVWDSHWWSYSYSAFSSERMSYQTWTDGGVEHNDGMIAVSYTTTLWCGDSLYMFTHTLRHYQYQLRNTCKLIRYLMRVDDKWC